MKVKFINLFVGLYIILSCFSVQVLGKPLYIEITGGKNYGIPIEVRPFVGPVQVDNMAQIIMQDLVVSSQFHKVLEIDQALKISNQDDNVIYWRQQGAQYLVTGTIEAVRNLYTVIVKVEDLVKNSIKLQLRYNNIKAHEIRALSHYVADKIFFSIIGVRGIFSTKLAYVATKSSKGSVKYSLNICDFDGYNQQELLISDDPLMSPAWSADGKKIAYVAFNSRARSSVRILNLDNRRVTIVSDSVGINGAPAWSADGKKLALVLSKEGDPKIYVYDLGNRILQKVTSGHSIDTEPCWNLAGDILYFTSNRGGKPQIYKVELSGLRAERVTYIGNYNARPRLTADGKRLVYLTRTETGDFNIATQIINSSNVSYITNSRLNTEPTLSPNDLMVAYVTLHNGKYVLGMVSLDARQKMLLAINAENVRHPAWSPFIDG